MADPSDPLGPFAPPAAAAAAGQSSSIGDAVAFVVERAWRLLVGPGALLVLAWLDRTDGRVALAASVIGLLLWLPTSAMLARVVFFPSPPDPGLLDVLDQPTSARDLRTLVRAHAAEHVLGTLLLVLLLVYVQRLFDARLAVPVMLVGGAIATFRGAQATVRLAVQEAEIDLAVGREERPLRFLERMSALRVPGFGDRAWMVLARARFRAGDAPGALLALDRVRQKGWRLDGLRAQMGVAVLPRAEVAAIRDALGRIRGGRSVAVVVDALLRLHEDQPLEPSHVEHLASLPDGEPRRLGLLLLAAARAGEDPDGARDLLAEGRFRPERLPSLARTWPAVARAVGPLVGSGAGGGGVR